MRSCDMLAPSVTDGYPAASLPHTSLPTSYSSRLTRAPAHSRPAPQALLLLRLEHEGSARQLLGELFAPPHAPALAADPSDPSAAASAMAITAPLGSAGCGSVAGSSTLLEAMRGVSRRAFTEPLLAEQLSGEQRRMLQVGFSCVSSNLLLMPKS